MLGKNLQKRILSLGLSFLLLAPFSTSFIQAEEIAASQGEISNKEIKQNIHGFSLKKAITLKEGSVLQFQHDKTGAWLVVEKNNNIDKEFSISVKTPPENDKGINHIIEHCVLNGSEKYSLKNIIWELSKIAHHTFLNAMTYPCFTTFPVASTDEDELESLAKIYTDGVFSPLFMKDEKIFKKEGIRYELDKQGKLTANGTVFNEMKQGASLDISNALLKKIFPDTQGKYLSGGIPENIIDLTYEELCETYKKYYHPSNMLIHLSGDINYERFMKWLNEEYLQNYDKSENNITYKSQDPEKLTNYEVIKYYKQQTEKNIYDANIVYPLNSETFLENKVMIRAISDILNNSKTARSKFIKEQGYLALSMSVVDDFYDVGVVINASAENMDLLSQEKIESLIENILKKFPITKSELQTLNNEKKFDKELEKATKLYTPCIATKEFINSWIKFDDPCSEKYFYTYEKHSNSKINEETLNNFISNELLNKKHTILVFTPSDDKNLSMTNKLEEKISKLESKKEELTLGYEDQKNWAESENNPTDLESLKKMFKKLSDIKTPQFKCDIQTSKLKKHKYYYAEQNIKNFVSYEVIFKANHLTDEDKKHLPILLNAINKNSTKNYSREELEEQKSDKLITEITLEMDSENKNAFFKLNILCQKDTISDSIKLVNEQINNLDFNDKKVLKEYATNEEAILSSTSKAVKAFSDLFLARHDCATNYMFANCSSDDTQLFYSNILKNIENNKFTKDIARKIKNIKDKIFNQSVIEGIGICCAEKNKDLAYKEIGKLISKFSSKKQNSNAKINFKSATAESIAFIDTNQTNNKILGIIDSKELSDDESFSVTSKIITNLFLMPNIREKLGAYGASISPDKYNHKVILCSYCDPNLKSTIEIFKSIPEFLEKCEIKPDEVESIAKSMLGSCYEKNRLSLAQSQLTSMICYGKDYSDNSNKTIENIKNISMDRIKQHAQVLKKLLPSMKVYSISNNISNEDRALFDRVID